VIEGLQDLPNFRNFAIEETGTLDTAAVEREVVETAQRIMDRDGSVGAILLECSLLPPYAAALQAAVQLPVFDYVTMIKYVFSAVVQRPYQGFM